MPIRAITQRQMPMSQQATSYHHKPLGMDRKPTDPHIYSARMNNGRALGTSRERERVRDREKERDKARDTPAK